MEKVIFNLGYNVEVPSLHCSSCSFNITEEKKLKKSMNLLRNQLKKEVKIIQVGEGLGIRLPNEIIKGYNIKRGEQITIQPETDCLRLQINPR